MTEQNSLARSEVAINSENKTTAIERDPEVMFHTLGTLTTITGWISGHDEGLAEWFKNARRAYQSDRADVTEMNRCAVVLFMDKKGNSPARIGFLDVGGANLEDVERWSFWQDPEASSPNSKLLEEETQGNGGKTYMYKLFRGPTRLLGIRDGYRNCKGLIGDANSEERGLPGFIPDIQNGRNLEISSWQAEISSALRPFDIRFEELPFAVQRAIESRKSFTLVEGQEPVGTGIFKGIIDADELLRKTLRHDQSTLAIEQLKIYAVKNGQVMNGGRLLELEPIVPFPGFEDPIVCEIPDTLPDSGGRTYSMLSEGNKRKGRVIIHTSRDNMYRKHKELRPRWKVSYRDGRQNIGSKPITDLIPAIPGREFVYATVELDAFFPDYVMPGRMRPNHGPLMEAVDLFVKGKLRDVAKRIHELRRHKLDEEKLDDVQQENEKMNNFIKAFLPEDMGGGTTGDAPGREIDPPDPPPPPPKNFGTIPATIETSWRSDKLIRIGNGVSLHLKSLIRPRIVDEINRTVPNTKLRWCSENRHVLEFENNDHAKACGKGRTRIWVEVPGSTVSSPKFTVDVWQVDHVLLTPRQIEIPLGKKEQIIAEVTNESGERATDVLLNWQHDADDSLIVRIRPSGWVVGNRLGRTSITAGAGDVEKGGVWARIPAEISVIENPDRSSHGSGIPTLLLTDRDVDPATGEVRPGDVEQPALWQETIDFQNNVWWLNLENPGALFHFERSRDDPTIWRSYHAQKVVEMVVQVHMSAAYSQNPTEERKDYWGTYKAAIEQFEVEQTQSMWEELGQYIETGKGLERHVQ